MTQKVQNVYMTTGPSDSVPRLERVTAAAEPPALHPPASYPLNQCWEEPLGEFRISSTSLERQCLDFAWLKWWRAWRMFDLQSHLHWRFNFAPARLWFRDPLPSLARVDINLQMLKGALLIYFSFVHMQLAVWWMKLIFFHYSSFFFSACLGWILTCSTVWICLFTTNVQNEMNIMERKNKQEVVVLWSVVGVS